MKRWKWRNLMKVDAVAEKEVDKKSGEDDQLDIDNDGTMQLDGGEEAEGK